MNEGILNATITDSFNNEFERRCISLLSNAYVSMQSGRRIDVACRDEYISAVLFDYIDKSAQAVKWCIDIAPEYRKYKNEVLKWEKTKKTAPKINMKFGGWTHRTNLDYFVETQNVIEIIPPEKKKGKSRLPIIISDFHKHYMLRIDSCLSGEYPVRGCIIGYILQGETQYTVNCLNHCLCDCNRVMEILKKRPSRLKEFDLCYISTHSDNRSIQHLMFNFSDDKSPEKAKRENDKEN
jgi:hypothetical protein